jgi:predicted DNA-binding transcriptional regulator AlpA
MSTIKLMDARELAAKLGVKLSWVKEHTRDRCPEADRIPCIRLGRYVRFIEAVIDAWIANGCKPLSKRSATQ